jgi:hypothetical protein
MRRHPEDFATRAAITPRRWPTALVAVVAARALTFSAVLFVRDRENALAATWSRANAARDALALASLERFARAMGLDASIRRAGVVGLQAIGIREFQARLVAPLGGVLEVGPHQWTLALDAGWACQTWLGRSGVTAMATAGLGVCTDNAPLVGSSGATPAQFRSAEARASSGQLAALDAAEVAAAIPSNTTRGTRFSPAAVDLAFARRGGTHFHVGVTSSGISVVAARSSACVQPTATHAQVRVTLGRCT